MLAYWLTLFLCVLSVPLCGFYLLLMMNYDGSSALPWTSVLPVLLTAVAWVTFDILGRAYRARAQHTLCYLVWATGAQGVTVLSFLPAAFSGTTGSGLAFACAVMAAIGLGATAEITLKAVRP
jgi:hypothetical protein